MKKKFYSFKHTLLFSILAIFVLSSCSDECETTITYTVFEPVYTMHSELRHAVKTEPARTLQQPGKIYAKGHFLFINEKDKGIHIVDNSNPATPRIINFINIPGNVDLAIKENILYADSYIDLVALDISDPDNIKLVKRIENIFPVNGIVYSDTSKVFVSSYNEKIVSESINSDCGGRPMHRGNFHTLSSNDSRGGFIPTSGKGGSMARFTITNNHLYTVGLNDMQLFNISTAANPVKGNKINLGWGIETIFPYQNKLFIGSTQGMHIYDNSNPESPQHLSTYAHVTSCDPVVVDGNLAWVTLRSGNNCAGANNQLDVIDISDARQPKLLKTYPMENPHGLGIDQKTLFLCEGRYGLKIFDVTGHLKVDENLKNHFKGHDAFDVIPLGKNLLMIGEDGLYQYDYSDLSQIKLLSKIPVTKP